MKNVSCIIPALNEEKYIGEVVVRIHKYMPKDISYEIIICDNGSTDKTLLIAQKAVVDRILCLPKLNISQLRNTGAEKACGQVLVFLDADIYLTEQWCSEFSSVFGQIMNGDKKILTGSRYGIDDKPSWIEKAWFMPIVEGESGKPNYINSGHLIISKKHFNEIGGFNIYLETGEDYDLGIRFKKSGGNVINNPRLTVIHKGYPKTIKDFCKREAWHGKGDFSSFKSFFASRTAQISLVTLGLSIFIILFFIIGSYSAAVFPFLALFLVLVFSIKYKLGKLKSSLLPQQMGLMYCYFMSRSLSFVRVLNNRSVRR